METRWEYRVLAVGTNAIANLELSLNQAGSVGWEAVGITAADRTLGLNQVQVILKRRAIALPDPDDLSAGWKPDPLGRHELRWWDGLRWESAVHDNGKASNDWPVK